MKFIAFESFSKNQDTTAVVFIMSVSLNHLNFASTINISIFSSSIAGSFDFIAIILCLFFFENSRRFGGNHGAIRGGA